MNIDENETVGIDTGDEYEDLTPEEIALIHEDSLVGRAYWDHLDWKEEEEIRVFCAPYVGWVNSL